MKLALALLLLTSPCFAFRNVAISSTTDPAVWENLRRASVDSNRKLDKYANDTVYGKLTLQGSTLTFTNPGAISNPNYVQFNTNYSDGFNEGRLQWNSEDGTLEVGMPGGNVNMQLGQENLIRAYNGSGADIGNGQAVYISSGAGVRPTIGLADADGASEKIRCPSGLATETIAAGHFGYVATYGLLRSTNTNSYTEGDQIYLSATPGNWTGTIPSGNAKPVPLGHVVYKHATEGVIFVDIHHYPETMLLSSATISNTGGLVISTYSATANGFTYIPGGLLLQWGYYPGGANNPTITFPKAFLTALYALTCQPIDSAAVNGVMSTITGSSTSNFSCEINRHDAAEYTSAFFWTAIGK